MQRAPVVILVHGAWHGPWAWEAVIERLTAEGIRTVAVDLPSKGFETALLGDLHDDAEAVRAAVDAAGGPALVVAHSYGGLPVSEGLAGCANLAHLIYLTAFMLEPGESLLGLRGGVEPEWWVTLRGRAHAHARQPQARLLQRLHARGRRGRCGGARPAAQGRLQPGAALRGLAARTPSTYVICERDNAIPPAAQERMSGARRHRQPARLRPCAVPLAPARRDGDHPGDAGGGRGGSALSGMAWTNWAGNQSCAARVATPASEDEVVAEVRRALADGSGIRPAGAGHSFTPIVATAGAVLETARPARHRARRRRRGAA